jgi:hypothetical protein
MGNSDTAPTEPRCEPHSLLLALLLPLPLVGMLLLLLRTLAAKGSTDASALLLLLLALTSKPSCTFMFSAPLQPSLLPL